MVKGTVKWLSLTKEFGFVVPRVENRLETSHGSRDECQDGSILSEVLGSTASAGICDDAIADAVAHLLRASAAVDRLARGEHASQSDQTALQLCQASLAIDRTMVALDGWRKAARAHLSPYGLRQSMRPDIERVLAQHIRRAQQDPTERPRAQTQANARPGQRVPRILEPTPRPRPGARCSGTRGCTPRSLWWTRPSSPSA
jgi:hypothetical protein